jgi:ribosomal protein S11
MADKKVIKKKKQKKNIISGLAYISATFNNTMVSKVPENQLLMLLKSLQKMLVLKQKNLVLRIYKYL